jgi:myo-inositol-1(or 4)-monophosphatase
MRRSPVMTMMIRAAEKAGKAVVRDFGEVEHLQASLKGPRDFVTKADEKAEKIIREELLHARPKFGFMMEGRDEVIGEDTSHRFIIDPIHGTTNFMHGIPYFAVSIALEESREVIAGVVYNPITDELFWAERNAGAYLHDRRLRVSSRTALNESLVAAPPFVPSAHKFGAWSDLVEKLAMVTTIRTYGAAALNLAHVAAGRLDGYVEEGLQHWDIAAGAIILQEAGGRITDFAGGKDWLKDGQVVCGSNDLHRKLLDVVDGK